MTQKTNPIYKFVFIGFLVLLIGYALFNSRHLLSGPQVEIVDLNQEMNVIKTTEKNYTIEGVAAFASYITINDLPISVDESGNFKQKMLLSEKVNPIRMIARDRFGKEIKKEFSIVYTGDEKPMTFDQIIDSMIKEVGLGTNPNTQNNTNVQNNTDNQVTTSPPSSNSQVGVE